MAASGSSFQIIDPVEESSGGATVSSASETLSDRKKRLEQERADLLREIEVKKLEAQIKLLRKQVDADSGTGEVDAPDDLTAETASTTSKRRRNEEADGESPSAKKSSSRGHIRTAKQEKYDGKTLHSLREHIRLCETTFRLSPRDFTDDATKVLYASQYLVGETASAFGRLEELNGQDKTP